MLRATSLLDLAHRRGAYGECDCVAVAALGEIVDRCHEDGQSDAEARSFDLRRVCAPYLASSFAFPDDSWPTPALVVGTRLGLFTPPWIDPLKRSVFVTKCVGLLAERGLRPDAHLRTYLGRPLARRVLGQAAHAYVDYRETGRPPDSYPHQVSDWFDEVAALDTADDHLQVLTARLLASEMADRVHEWVKTAAIAHLVDWRVVGSMSVKIDSRDLILSGGLDATIWVLDRFYEVPPEAWRHRQ